MALAPLPPWLNVNPSNFVDASRAGSAIGLQIAEAKNRADREGVDAAIRMNQMAQREEEAAQERALRQWELQQKIRQDAMQMAETSRYHDLSIKEAMAGHAAQAVHYKAMEEAAKARAGGSGIMPTEWQRDPTKEYITKNGAVIQPKRMLPTEYKTVTEKQDAVIGSPGIPAQAAQKKYGLFGIDWLARDQPAIPGVPAVPGHGERTITTRIPTTAADTAQLGLAPAPVATKPQGKPWTDKSGKKWRYLGNDANPKLDRNAANWVEE